MTLFQSSKLTLIAALLAAVQLICACFPTNASTQNLTPEAMATTQHGGDCDATATDDETPNHNCAHCDGAAIFVEAQTSNLKSAPLADEPVAVVISVDGATSRSGFAPTALAALRWLDPPTSTPVTQKIRLLI